MGKVSAAAGWGRRGEGDRNVLPADLHCVVVRFGGAAVTWRGREGSSSDSRRQDGLPAPPEPRDQLGARWEPQGSWLPSSPQSRAGGWGGFALFLDPSNGVT